MIGAKGLKQNHNPVQETKGSFVVWKSAETDHSLGNQQNCPVVQQNLFTPAVKYAVLAAKVVHVSKKQPNIRVLWSVSC